MVSNDYAYILEKYNDILHVISISDPENPEEIGLTEIRGGSSLEILGNILYITDPEAGLTIVSVVNPENPTEVGYFDTPGVANDISVTWDGLICVADQSNMGVYHFTGENAVNDPNFTTPTNYKLYAAYPNPFNSQTRIHYDLPSLANVKVSILDINGRTVDVLDQGMKTLGQHHLYWDGSGFVSGTYFVRLDASKHRRIQKLMLIR